MDPEDDNGNVKATAATVRMVIPKGRIYDEVSRLLHEAGVGISADGRSYRPVCKASDIDVKMLKPRNIGTLVGMGTHDIGFTGRDWIAETRADVEILMDLGFNPVRLVAAIPVGTDMDALRERKIVVASEYRNLTERFCEVQGLTWYFLQTYGATEVYPPDDADMIVDNVATGRTLRQNDLVVCQEIMTSSTCLIANRQAMQDPIRRRRIDELILLFRSVLEARRRVMLEMNVQEADLEGIISILPCMRSPTVNRLQDGGYAVKSVVPREDLSELIPRLKEMGARDIIESDINRVVA